MRIEVEPYLGIDVRTDQKTKTALELASTLGVPDTTIAATVEEKLRRLDEESEFEEMAEVVRHLISRPRAGITDVSRGSETAQRRPARTWRLSEVDPELSTEWRRTAEQEIRLGPPA